MPKKTFNIGECSYYGRWRIEIKKEEITLTGMDWDTRKVERVKKFTVADVHTGDMEYYIAAEVATSYWASMMLEWVNKHVPKKENAHAW